MRKVVILGICLAVFVVVSPAWAGHTTNGCANCHRVHNADDSSDPNGSDVLEGVDIPLWGGTLADTTGDPFTPYSSTTLNATDVNQPNGSSLMCLGCHDGTEGVTFADPNHDLGQDLSKSHPISFVYDSALFTDEGGASGGLEDPENDTWAATGNTIDEEALDSSHRMQCSSCHDVHAMHTDAALRVDNTAGALCKQCHNK